MTTRWWCALTMVLCLAACGEQDDADVDEPEAVEPVEIVGDGEEADGTQTATVDGEETDVAALQARIAELEVQLAQCQGEDATAEGGTQTAAVPEGVDVPGGGDSDADDSSATGDSTETASASSARRGRRGRREPGLLGALLGDGEGSEGSSGRRGRRGSDSDSDSDDDGVALDPARVLFGE